MKFCQLTCALLLISGEANAVKNKLSKQLTKSPKMKQSSNVLGQKIKANIQSKIAHQAQVDEYSSYGGYGYDKYGNYGWDYDGKYKYDKYGGYRADSYGGYGAYDYYDPYGSYGGYGNYSYYDPYGSYGGYGNYSYYDPYGSYGGYDHAYGYTDPYYDPYSSYGYYDPYGSYGGYYDPYGSYGGYGYTDPYYDPYSTYDPYGGYNDPYYDPYGGHYDPYGGYYQPDVVEQIMNDLDKDYDGQISKAEFKDFLQSEVQKALDEIDEYKKHLKEQRKMMWEQWKVISGGKGYVTRADLEAHRDMLH